MKLACVFGSRATGNAGPLADYDFAVYLDERNRRQMFEIQLALMNKLQQHLESNDVEVIVLNMVEGPELKYSIICTGRLLYEQEPFKVLVEPRIMTEYFDFHESLRRHGLTKA